MTNRQILMLIRHDRIAELTYSQLQIAALLVWSGSPWHQAIKAQMQRIELERTQ